MSEDRPSVFASRVHVKKRAKTVENTVELTSLRSFCLADHAFLAEPFNINEHLNIFHAYRPTRGTSLSRGVAAAVRSEVAKRPGGKAKKKNVKPAYGQRRPGPAHRAPGVR